MSSLTELEQLVEQNQNILFIKVGCPYCARALSHADYLVEQGVITSYATRTVGQDFENPELAELVNKNGGELISSDRASKPQVFMQGKYIGDSQDFSQWQG